MSSAVKSLLCFAGYNHSNNELAFSLFPSDPTLHAQMKALISDKREKTRPFTYNTHA